jgi:hypothetical protein
MRVPKVQGQVRQLYVPDYGADLAAGAGKTPGALNYVVKELRLEVLPLWNAKGMVGECIFVDHNSQFSRQIEKVEGLLSPESTTWGQWSRMGSTDDLHLIFRATVVVDFSSLGGGLLRRHLLGWCLLGCSFGHFEKVGLG